MNWNFLEYLCRRVHFGNYKAESLTSLRDAFSQQFSNERNERFRATSEKSFLQLVESNDKEGSAFAISVYAHTNFSREFQEPQKWAKIFSYLSTLLIFYLVMLATFHFFVFPSFIHGLESFSVEEANRFTKDTTPILLVSCVTTLVLMFGAFFTFQVGKVASGHNPKRTGSRTWWIPSSIASLSSRIQETLTYPVNAGQSESEIYSLVEYSKDPAIIANELSTKLGELQRELNVLTWRYVLGYLIFSGLLIILSIFLLLSSTYSPIFKFAQFI